MSVFVAGIDASLTGTAVCVLRANDNEPVVMARFGSHPAVGLRERLNRYEGLICDVVSVLNDISGTIGFVTIEGYSFNSRGGRALDRVEYGGLLRSRLTCTWAVREVPPATLKKFVTGKGNADKLTVGLAVQKRYGQAFKTDDEFDAYALAKIGLILAGITKCDTAFQREAIEKLRLEHK